MKKIAFDVMGSDNGLIPAIDAAIRLLDETNDLEITFYGVQEEIEKHLSTKKIKNPKFKIVNTTEVIEMTDGIMDIRRKKDSSMVKALEAAANNEVDGMVTGGNSAAFIAGGHFILKEFDGIERPGFMPLIPTVIKDKVVLMIDVGANIENTAEDLVNFAIMASTYSKGILKIENPVVGLLNIGSEKSKGKEYHKEAYQLLEKTEGFKFYGNIEAREIASGTVDIIVTDGYTGNIALKALEGMGKSLLKEIKASITKTFFRKLAALRLKRAFKEVAAKFDYKNHAGAILLGVQKIAFKSHGSSDERSFLSTLRMAYKAISEDVINVIQKNLGK